MTIKLTKIKFIKERRFIPQGYIGSYPDEQAQKLIADGYAIEIKMLDEVEQQLPVEDNQNTIEIEEGEE